jgi:TolB protein
MRKLLLVVLLLVCLQAGISARQDVFSFTNQGVVGVKIAVPEFQPATADPKTASHAAIFNQVLMDDLNYSAGVTVVSRSYYPIGKFSSPGDIKPEDWTKPAVDAQFIAFGNLRMANGALFAEARLWDLKNPANREAHRTAHQQ